MAACRLTIQYPSLVQGLADRWTTALVAAGDWQAGLSLPLVKIMPTPLGTVATPLPLQLASHDRRKTIQEWGTFLIEALQQASPSLAETPRGWLHAQGWLYVTWSPRSLADWLQCLLSAQPHFHDPPAALPALPSGTEEGISSDPVLFQLQYAHARCCSVLRLAQAQGILPLPFTTLPDHWQAATLWLTAEGQWRSHTASEQALLRALLGFPQALSTEKGLYSTETLTPSTGISTGTLVPWPVPLAHLYHQAAQWGVQFLAFYSECRLFGEIHPDVQQMRLALVWIVQRVLAFLLEQGFALTAPQKL